LIYILVSI